MSAPLSTVGYRDVPGFTGYRVGDDGSLWSRRAAGPWKTLRKDWRRIVPKLDSRGRVRVPLYKGDRKSPHWRFLHRLILEAFAGPCPPGMVGCHGNDDPRDNRLENLRWDTHAANSADAVRNGRYRLGSAHHNGRFTAEQVRAIRRAHADGASVISLAIITGVSETAIRLIVRRRNWAWLG